MASREQWEFRDWAMTYIPTLVAPLLANPHCWWNHSNTRSVRRVIIKIARKLFLITLDEYSMNGKKFFIHNKDIFTSSYDSIKVCERMWKKKKKKAKWEKGSWIIINICGLDWTINSFVPFFIYQISGYNRVRICFNRRNVFLQKYCSFKNK